MCHLLLLAPVFGLLIFWLSPIWVAVPVYGVILLLSILLYVATVRMMRLPQITGVYSLLQRPGVVIDVTDRGPHRGSSKSAAAWKATQQRWVRSPAAGSTGQNMSESYGLGHFGCS